MANNPCHKIPLHDKAVGLTNPIHSTRIDYATPKREEEKLWDRWSCSSLILVINEIKTQVKNPGTLPSVHFSYLMINKSRRGSFSQPSKSELMNLHYKEDSSSDIAWAFIIDSNPTCLAEVIHLVSEWCFLILSIHLTIQKHPVKSALDTAY